MRARTVRPARPSVAAKPAPPRSQIVRGEDEPSFLREVDDLLRKGFRPLQDMKIFASYDQKKGGWRTLYIMPMVHFEELREFQTVPTSEKETQEERMFG